MNFITHQHYLVPIKLCYADVVKLRETITSGLEWIRVAQL
jgi:tRNA threonylcarbamoyladenosine modification (KEOPS) complex  Pcc1 subunit